MRPQQLSKYKKLFSTAAASPDVTFPKSLKELPNYVLDTPKTKVTTLENGMRVASEDAFGETGV